MSERMGKFYGEIATNGEISANSIKEDLREILEKSSFESETSNDVLRLFSECFRAGPVHAYLIFRIGESGTPVVGKGLPEEFGLRVRYKAISIHVEGPKEDPYFMNAARDLREYFDCVKDNVEGA